MVEPPSCSPASRDLRSCSVARVPQLSHTVTFSDLIPEPDHQDPTWDFTPFLDAPAVIEKAGHDGRINLLNIPQTEIPSPLARNLEPSRVLELKEHLVGKYGESEYGGNGREIWLSWKRAWDLWNNYYIEGRVNPIWVRKEWERMEKAQAGLDDAMEQRSTAMRDDVSDGIRAHRGLRLDDQIPRYIPLHERRPTGLAGSSVATGLGDESVTGQPEESPKQSPQLVSGNPKSTDNTLQDDSDIEMGGMGLEVRDAASGLTSDSESLSELQHSDSAGLEASGGYFAVKDLPDYKEPESDNEENCSFWKDVVENSVWRPRRVGEKTLRIDLDEDIEEFFKNSDLEVDGGVDCGRSPYPVLRSVVDYIRTKEGAFKKKKVWDRVTGTLFNMPVKPHEPDTDSEDEREKRIKAVYWDSLRDRPLIPDNGLFPLDIRRVLKVTRERGPKYGLDDSEKYARDPHLWHEIQYREIDKEDPWWVTGCQKAARDVPPRRHPPKQEEFGFELLPIIDQLWKEEVARDHDHDAGYFVTNLHGGTLLVNGMEVRKGDVAGPLPEFAVVECPGGQIAFWWGVNGRHYLGGRKGVDFSVKWDILRRWNGWKHVAMTTGEVWVDIFRDRRRREMAGEAEDDDGQWYRWKRAKSAVDLSRRCGAGEPPDLYSYGPIPIFSSGLDELKWLAAQEDETQRLLDARQGDLELAYPDHGSFWPGSTPPRRKPQAFTQVQIDARWTFRKDEICDAQRGLNRKMREETEMDKEERDRQGTERNKRPASDDLGGGAKRVRLEPEKLQQEIGKDDSKKGKEGESQSKRLVGQTPILLRDKTHLDGIERDQRAVEDGRNADRMRILEVRNTQSTQDMAALQAKRNAETNRRTKPPMITRVPTTKTAPPVTAETRKDMSEKAIQAQHRQTKDTAITDQLDRQRADIENRRKAKDAAAAAAAAAAAKAATTPPKTPNPTWKTSSKSPEEAQPPPPASGSSFLQTPKPKLSVKANWKPEPHVPTGYDAGLQTAIENSAEDGPELHKAIQNSLDTFSTERNQALKTRAAAGGQTALEYAQSQGFSSIDQYTQSIARDSEIIEENWSPVGDGLADMYFKKKHEQLEEQIRNGLMARAILAHMDIEQWARANGKESVDAWVAEEAARHNLTLADLPSQKRTRDMTPAERRADQGVWEAWCQRLFDAGNWEDRIRSLPPIPGDEEATEAHIQRNEFDKYWISL